MSFDYQILFQQLGGNKFKVMTGAYNFISDKMTFLSFRFKGSKKANYLKISYEEIKDLYVLEFGLIKGDNYNKLPLISDIYAEDMQKIFTEVTGLDTHL